MGAETALQGALFSAVTALGLQCYDVAPQAPDGGSIAVFPYVTLGLITLNPFDTTTSTGFEWTATLHVRSRSGSMKEAKEIQAQLYAALHRQPLTVTGFQTVLVLFANSTPLQAPDGSFHGVSEFRGLITT